MYFPYDYIYPEQYSYMLELKRTLDAKVGAVNVSHSSLYSTGFRLCTFSFSKNNKQLKLQFKMLKQIRNDFKPINILKALQHQLPLFQILLGK